jgi:uncharacterized membrane protein YebE (DUF533 family)
MESDHILARILGSGAASGFGGAFAGSLAGSLLSSKKGRKLGKKALKVGGIAAVGGLAWAAWNRARSQDAGAAASRERALPASSLGRFVPEAGDDRGERLGVLLLQAMIAAAHADGRLDGPERRTIFTQLRSLGLSAAERADLAALLEKPVDLNTLVSAARTPEIAAEVYTASLLAIDVDTPAERAYLSLLAARLGLPPELVESLHRELETLPAAPERGAAPARAAWR